MIGPCARAPSEHNPTNNTKIAVINVARTEGNGLLATPERTRLGFIRILHCLYNLTQSSASPFLNFSVAITCSFSLTASTLRSPALLPQFSDFGDWFRSFHYLDYFWLI